MLHHPEPAAAATSTPSVAWPNPRATTTPVASNDIATALASSPIHLGAGVRVSEVMCRTGEDDRASEAASEAATEHAQVVTAAHHVVLPRDGALLCSTRRERVARMMLVDPAMALLVAPGQRVSVRNATSGDHALTVVTVTPALLDLAGENALGVCHTGFGAIVLSPAAMLDAQRVRTLAAMIRELRPWHPETASATLAAATVALMRHFVPTHDRAAITTGVRRSMSRTARATDTIRSILAAEPGAQHTLDSVSARVGISPFHLARVFHARTGFSIHQYLLRVRMARALLALGDGETSLSRLALTLGFCSHSHFATTFRRHFGVSPRDVRAMLRERPTEPRPLDRCACAD